MSNKQLQSQFISAQTVSEGAGVTVHRSIGSPALRNYDPFMMLDYFGSDKPNEYIAGFPDHPHRGFNTFTYMIDGNIEHQDSMGNTGNLGPGGAQWMKAASGVIHSEMPKQQNGLMRGFQLWINLPAAHKMDPPEYQEYQSQDFPVINTDNYQVKVVIGQFENKTSPIQDEITHVSYLDVSLEAGKNFQHQLPKAHNNLIFVFEGDGKLSDKSVSLNTLVALGAQDHQLNFTAGDSETRFIVISGQPIKEPVVQYGPFVMNTRAEIDQAIDDYQTNQFVRDRAWVNRKAINRETTK